MARSLSRANSGPLSKREKQVARLIVSGLSNAEIGKDLGISEQTVKRHLYNAFDKEGVNTRLELGMKLVQQGRLGDSPSKQLRHQATRIAELEYALRLAQRAGKHKEKYVDVYCDRSKSG